MDTFFPNGQSHRVELSLGPIHYEEAGDGPTLVFVHGALVDGSLWRDTARALSKDHRCIVPTWPLGSHTEAMTGDVSVTAVAELIGEFLERLDLEDVTLLGNDSGGLLTQLVAVHHAERVRDVVLTNCDAFEVFPPKDFEYFFLLPKIPGALTVLSKEMNLFPALARMKTAFGDLTVGRLDDETIRRWMGPAAKNRAVRKDLAQLLRSVDRQTSIDVSKRLGDFAGRALLVWGSRDQHFTLDLAHRLEAAFVDAELVEIETGTTFVMMDEPERVADAVRRFVAGAAQEPKRPVALASA